MWSKIESYFEPYPARWKVVSHLVRQGLSISDGSIWSGDVEIPAASLARACGVDRRVVSATIECVERDDFIRGVFRDLEPTLFLARVAPRLGYGVLEVMVEDPQAPGIVQAVTSEIAAAGISIRQVVADDPRFTDPPMLTVITDSPLPGELLERIKAMEGVIELIIR